MAVFAVADPGFDLLVRLSVLQSHFTQALGETLHDVAARPVGALLRLVPFLLLGWMAASLARRKTMSHGARLFLLGAAILSLMYFEGHVEADHAMLRQRWDAATFAIGQLPYRSIPILLALLALRFVMAKAPRAKQV